METMFFLVTKDARVVESHSDMSQFSNFSNSTHCILRAERCNCGCNNVSSRICSKPHFRIKKKHFAVIEEVFNNLQSRDISTAKSVVE